MPINKQNVIMVARLLGARHTRCLIHLAQKQDKLENEWTGRVNKMHERITKEIVRSLEKTGKAHVDQRLIDELLLSHYMDVIVQAERSTRQEIDALDREKKLARRQPPIPRSLKDIRRIYDDYKRRGLLPRALTERAKVIRDQYLKKTQSVWKKYSEDFRQGTEATQEDVVRRVRRAADTAKSRAKTIVRTETTNYYNTTRREIYDQTDAVWGYLFLAIRDQATTKWCSDKVTDGKRGRHGLVYKKGDAVTEKETPACHWNCRSEMVPLVWFNPRHRRIIEDYRRRRTNHVCHSLPVGWR